MKKTIFLLMLLIMAAGCQQFGKDTKGKLPDSSAAYTGSDGLVMKFLDNAPPSVVPANSYFPLGLYLQNKGAVDIANGKIVIRHPEDMIWLSRSSFAVNIEGKETIMTGGRQVNIVDGQTKNPGKIGTEKPKARISATSCYDYATKLSTGLCVNPDPYGLKKLAGKKAACETKTLAFNSQGAPVVITKIEPVTTVRGEAIDMTLRVYLANRNSGIVYRKGSDFCGSKEGGANSIFVRASLLGRDTACSPAELVLSDRSDENYVICSFADIQTEGAFVTQLSVVAEYGYSTTITKDFAIESIAAGRETCRPCTGNQYLGVVSAAGCQNFGEKSYLTALHEKCYNGCIVQYPDFTAETPTEC